MQLVGFLGDETVGLAEEELAGERTVDDDAAQPGCIVVARGVVVAIDTRVERRVGVEVGHRVNLGGTYVAKLPVDGPHVESSGDFLVLGGVVAQLVEVVVFGSILIDI